MGLEEKAEKAKEAKEGEKTDDAKKDEKTDDANKEEKTEESKKEEKTEESKKEEKTDEVEKVKEEEKKDCEEAKEKEKEEEAKEFDEAMEEGDETGTEGEEEGEKKDEEQEPSNLQLAWEMLELAKVVYSKQLEAGEGDKAHLEERLCSTMLALGEVSIENENYKQAVDDIQDCLKKQANLPKDARIVAETYYQLGVAQGFNAQHDEAVESLKSAINIIQEGSRTWRRLRPRKPRRKLQSSKLLFPEIEEK